MPLLAAVLPAAQQVPQPQRELAPPRLAPPSAGGEGGVSTDGTANLSWAPGPGGAVGAVDAGVTYELEESTGGGEPTRIDAGPHLAAALSGRDDGVYRYRVRALANGEAGPWSEPVELRVEHHSLAFACAVFAVGAVVFLATAGLVVLGHRSASRAALDR